MACLIGAIAAPAQAWEYARWGMTPNELVRASGGAARPMAEPTARSDGKLVAKAEAEARFGVVSVAAEFRFDAVTNRLAEVGLREQGTAPCAALSDRLRGRYGEPASTARFGEISTFGWRDSTRAARVTFIAVELTAGVRCSIVYSDADRAE